MGLSNWPTGIDDIGHVDGTESTNHPNEFGLTHSEMHNLISDAIIAIEMLVARVQENVNTITTSGSGTVILPDVTTATLNLVTLTGNPTLTFPAAAAGKNFALALIQDIVASRTVTWPTTIKWAASTAPTLTTTAAKTDTFSFVCYDGAHWIGYVTGQNF